MTRVTNIWFTSRNARECGSAPVAEYLYTDEKYIGAKVEVQCGEATACQWKVNIFDPYGKQVDSITIKGNLPKAGTYPLFFTPMGNDEATLYSTPGDWRWEMWDADGTLLGETFFTIRPAWTRKMHKNLGLEVLGMSLHTKGSFEEHREDKDWDYHAGFVKEDRDDRSLKMLYQFHRARGGTAENFNVAPFLKVRCWDPASNPTFEFRVFRSMDGGWGEFQRAIVRDGYEYPINRIFTDGNYFLYPGDAACITLEGFYYNFGRFGGYRIDIHVNPDEEDLLLHSETFRLE